MGAWARLSEGWLLFCRWDLFRTDDRAETCTKNRMVLNSQDANPGRRAHRNSLLRQIVTMFTAPAKGSYCSEDAAVARLPRLKILFPSSTRKGTPCTLKKSRPGFHSPLRPTNEQENRRSSFRDNGRVCSLPLAWKRSGVAKLCRASSDSFSSFYIARPNSELEPFHSHRESNLPISALAPVEQDHILRALEVSNWIVRGGNGAAERSLE
jgi:hypothetical protein